MIESLSISNYALIDNIELKFTPGLNIITGETGAGKSIMLGALSMLFGNRADTRVVRDKDKKSVVEAVFNVSRYAHIRPIVEANDIEWNDKELILRREITPAGRSRSFVNDVPVQLSALKQIATLLVDIHSQHQNLLLSNPEYQLSVIDILIPDQSLKTQYAEAYDQYRSAMKKYQSVKRAIAASKAEEEYFRYQLAYLDELKLQDDEIEQLEAERDLLANAGDIRETLSRLVQAMSEGENNVSSLLRYSEHEAAKISDLKDLEGIAERLESLRIEADDIAATFESLENNIEANPARLEVIEERLSDLYEALRKFGAESIGELIAKRDELSVKIDAIDNGEELLKAHTAKAKAAKRNAAAIAAKLSEARKKEAEIFAETLRQNAVPLGMKNLIVNVDFNTIDLSPSGIDDVNFLVAFNKNQQPMPVKDTASGGEISRLMLTIKSIIASRMQLPTIIFDEIDTGVSGDVANRMGLLMQQLSQSLQVISITHLPQIAAKGVAHFKVYKEDSDETTNTRVRPLDNDMRIDELALMLSGDPYNEAARATARTLLVQNK